MLGIIGLKLQPKYAYTTSHDLSPIRRATTSILRLYLLHELAQYSPNEIKEYADDIDFKMSKRTRRSLQLHSAMVIAIPGDLSPGEYHLIGLTMAQRLIVKKVEA